MTASNHNCIAGHLIRTTHAEWHALCSQCVIFQPRFVHAIVYFNTDARSMKGISNCMARFLIAATDSSESDAL